MCLHTFTWNDNFYVLWNIHRCTHSNTCTLTHNVHTLHSMYAHQHPHPHTHTHTHTHPHICTICTIAHTIRTHPQTIHSLGWHIPAGIVVCKSPGLSFCILLVLQEYKCEVPNRPPPVGALQRRHMPQCPDGQGTRLSLRRRVHWIGLKPLAIFKNRHKMRRVHLYLVPRSSKFTLGV